jgi:hypothetical protein
MEERKQMSLKPNQLGNASQSLLVYDWARPGQENMELREYIGAERCPSQFAAD